MAGVIFDGKLVAPAVVVEKELSTIDPLWPDIKHITDNAEEVSDRVKFGLLCYGFSDSFTVFIGFGYMKVITSDGAIYSSDEVSGNITHTWDKTKDIIDSNGFPVRYIIVYIQEGNASSNAFSYEHFPCVVHAYIKGNFAPLVYNKLFLNQVYLTHVEINGSVIDDGSAFVGCASLKEIPKNIIFNLDGITSVRPSYIPFSGTNITKYPVGFVPTSRIALSGTTSSYWPSLPSVEILPEFFYHIDYTNISYMGGDKSAFGSLVLIPDGIDFSKVTSFNRAFLNLPKLAYAGTVDMSANTTTFSSKTYSPFNVQNLRDIKCTLPSNTNIWFNNSTKINIESFRFMADHAPDVTATPRTLTVGSTNITRINEADPTIITDLNAKGWTVA